MQKLARIVAVVGLLVVAGSAAGRAQTPEFELIKPSAAATGLVTKFDEPNMIVRPAKMDGAPLLLWMAGTQGRPENAKSLLSAAARQGYRAIGLEYNDAPAITQVCGRVEDRSCSEKFREMRIWGTGGFSGVGNSVEESISARLVALLKELAKRHPKEGWESYVTPDGKPMWSRIAVAGQSQGAGMAAFIAKKEKVLRVVLFSSPIDYFSGPGGSGLAPWLTWPSATPADRWYAERNSREPLNGALVRSYPALGVPAADVRVFSLDLPAAYDSSNAMAYHLINIQDPRYAPEWNFLFGEASER